MMPSHGFSAAGVLASLLVIPSLAVSSPAFLGENNDIHTESTELGGTIYGHPDLNKAYPEHDGFKLWFVEEFNDPLDLDTDEFWTWADGGLDEGRVRFVKEAITFPDGKMRITAQTNSTEPIYETQECSQAYDGTWIGPKEYTSGEVRTRRNMFRYGRYEVRMKSPAPQASNTSVNGNYIAKFFVSKDSSEFKWREIDIEVVGTTPDTVKTNVWYVGSTDNKDISVGHNLRDGFHDFAFEWYPDSIKWFFDGVLIREDNTTTFLHESATKIMFSLWIFGSMGTDTYGYGGDEGTNNQYPMMVEYDWFRYYKWNGEDQYPCEGMSLDCLTDNDKWSANNPCDGIEQNGIQCNATCEAEPTTTTDATPLATTTTTTNIDGSPLGFGTGSAVATFGGVFGIGFIAYYFCMAEPAEEREVEMRLQDEEEAQ